jgi:hypothetical protein
VGREQNRFQLTDDDCLLSDNIPPLLSAYLYILATTIQMITIATPSAAIWWIAKSCGSCCTA